MDLDLDQVEENSNDDYGDDEIRPQNFSTVDNSGMIMQGSSLDSFDVVDGFKSPPDRRVTIGLKGFQQN